MIASEAEARSTSDWVIPPTADAHDLDLDLVALELLELRDGGLDRALDVALDDQRELLDLALGAEDAGPGRLVLGRAEELLDPLALLALAGELARHAIGLDHAALLAGGGRAVEAEDLDGDGRAGLLDRVAVVVEHRPDPAPGGAGDERVAGVERAPLDEHRRHRAAADVEPRLDDRARGLGRPVRLQLQHVGLEEEHLEERVEPGPLAGRDVHEDRLAAPLLRLQPAGGELLADALRVRSRLVDLVDGDDDRHLGGAGVVDRLDRLRHHAVVRGDDEDDDVRDLRAAGPHLGEGLVTRACPGR